MNTPLPPLLLRGDCLAELARIPDESIDAVVTDPPYGLANTDPAHVVEALTRWAQGDRDFIPSGRGFMGKEWDAFVPPPAVWDDARSGLPRRLRVHRRRDDAGVLAADRGTYRKGDEVNGKKTKWAGTTARTESER